MYTTTQDKSSPKEQQWTCKKLFRDLELDLSECSDLPFRLNEHGKLRDAIRPA